MKQRIARLSLGFSFALAVASAGCDIDVNVPAGSSQSTSSNGSGAGNGAGGAGSGGASNGGSGGNSGNVGSRCTETPDHIACPYEVTSLPAQAGILRDVLYQVPLGTPPNGGFPVVIFFQGSFYGPALMFDVDVDASHGGIHVAQTIKSLLDAGYAVIAPEAHAEGGTFWDTNIPPFSVSWTTAPDHAFMVSILAAISDGKFGPLNASRKYATGISSGGYMTSRMAVSYQGQFRALAVHSGSYATCSGPICIIPDALPNDHPPTLFLHGEKDLTVPISTMKNYEAKLKSSGKETRIVTDPNAGHEWISAGAQEVVDWFDAHP